MDIRKFKLINSGGEEWDLNSLDSFFMDVRGLGFEQAFEFEEVGDFFLEISKHPKQATPKGTIVFSSYTMYRYFILFVQQTPLTLKYSVEIGGNYSEISNDVEIKSLDKGDMESGALKCDIEFLSLGYYYIESEYQISEGEADGFPYTFPFTFADDTAGSVEIESDTSIDSPCKFTIFGPCTNPSWSHYVNGVEKTSGKVNCAVSAGERLVVDCQSIPYLIKKYDNFLNEIEDCYKDSDFATGRFVYVENGINKISFAHEGTESLSVSISVKFNYQGG